MKKKKNQFPEKDEIIFQVKQNEKLQKLIPKVMSFAASIADDVKEFGLTAFELAMPFDETKILQDNIEFIRRALELQQVFIFAPNDKNIPDPIEKKENAQPVKPTAIFY